MVRGGTFTTDKNTLITVLTAVTSGRFTTSGWLHGAVQMYNAAQPTKRSLTDQM